MSDFTQQALEKFNELQKQMKQLQERKNNLQIDQTSEINAAREEYDRVVEAAREKRNARIEEIKSSTASNDIDEQVKVIQRQLDSLMVFVGDKVDEPVAKKTTTKKASIRDDVVDVLRNVNQTSLTHIFNTLVDRGVLSDTEEDRLRVRNSLGSLTGSGTVFTKEYDGQKVFSIDPIKLGVVRDHKKKSLVRSDAFRKALY